MGPDISPHGPPVADKAVVGEIKVDTGLDSRPAKPHFGRA